MSRAFCSPLSPMSTSAQWFDFNNWKHFLTICHLPQLSYNCRAWNYFWFSNVLSKQNIMRLLEIKLIERFVLFWVFFGNFSFIHQQYTKLNIENLAQRNFDPFWFHLIKYLMSNCHYSSNCAQDPQPQTIYKLSDLYLYFIVKESEWSINNPWDLP